MGDSGVGVKVLGVAAELLLGGVAEVLLGGVVTETFNEGTSEREVEEVEGGALVLRIRSTLMFATIRIISISPNI